MKHLHTQGTWVFLRKRDVCASCTFHETQTLPCDVYRRATQNYFNTCPNSLGIKWRVQNIRPDIYFKTAVLCKPVPTVRYVRSSYMTYKKVSFLCIASNLHIHFLQLRPSFYPRADYVGLMAGKVVLKQVSLRTLRFPSLTIIPPVLHPHNHSSAPQWPRLHLNHCRNDVYDVAPSASCFTLNKISTTIFFILDTIWHKCYWTPR
jgi:hypothetical protein